MIALKLGQSHQVNLNQLSSKPKVPKQNYFFKNFMMPNTLETQRITHFLLKTLNNKKSHEIKLRL